MKIARSRPMLHFHDREAQIGLLDRVFVRNEGKEPDFNRRMFDEDFSQIFHYPNRRSGALFDITTNDQDLSERLLASVDTRYSPHGGDETIREWTEEIANALILSGKAYYHLWDDPDSEDIRIRSFGPSGEKRAKVGDALRGGISWRCRVAVNSLPRKGYATCQRLRSCLGVGGNLKAA